MLLSLGVNAETCFVLWEIKFRALPDRLLARDPSAWIATGHYARLLPSPVDPTEPALHRGSFLPKDQSYYLSTSPIAALSRTLFPLGELSKTEVRSLARQWNLSTSERAERSEEHTSELQSQ